MNWQAFFGALAFMTGFITMVTTAFTMANAAAGDSYRVSATVAVFCGLGCATFLGLAVS